LDKRPITVGGNDVYYQCADLVLTKDGAPDNAPDADTTTGATDPGSHTSATATMSASDDGCGAASGSAWAVVLLMARGIATARNRRRA